MALLAKYRHWFVTFGLSALLIVAVIGMVMTRDMGQAPARSRRNSLIDQKPLRTARNMAALASGWEEQRYARQALRLADHEVDLEFAIAFRDASEQAVPQTPEARQAYDRVSKAEAAVKSDEGQVVVLKKKLSASHSDMAQQQLNLLQAQLELDKDELDDAREDLSRVSGGDTRNRLQRLFQRHQADEQQIESLATASGPNRQQSDPQPANLLAQFSAWNTLRNKRGQLKQARDEIISRAVGLSARHNSLAEEVEAARSGQGPPNQQAANSSSGGQAAQNASADPGATIASLQRLSKRQKDLADLDRRKQDCQELADTYYNWMGRVELRERGALHGVIRSALWIVIILLLIYEAGRLIDRLFADVTYDRKRLQTLRVVVRFAVQTTGVVVIIFVILGLPAQMATILGLAGAGLTVVLKDFIVAFFGWFVLMGRNGIRVGDWVEVNGVVGEVAEINLMRTILLETGNWTDTGHPTGRKVAFLNSFAIEGHFFNFSTAGQWLWDELQILVPATQDPYSIIEDIQKLVAEETETHSKTAEQEWHRATSQYRVPPVSAAPAIHLRPTSSGVEVHVRYITRAQDRYSTRARLYQALADLLHQRSTPERAEALRSGR